MKQRILTAIIAIPIVFIVLYIGGIIAFAATAFISTIGYLEYKKLLENNGISVAKYAVIIAGIFILFLAYSEYSSYLLGTTVLGFFICIGSYVFNYKTGRLNDIVYTYIGFIYVYISFAYLLLILLKLEAGLYWTVLTFALVWLNDTGAYLVGRKFGKYKLSIIISPNKTIEGAIGGIITTIFTAYFFNQFIYHYMDNLMIIPFAIIVAILGIIGDLWESLLKREAGVKDSGDFFPGHGGVLDRMDSVLFVAPFIYAFVVKFIS